MCSIFESESFVLFYILFLLLFSDMELLVVSYMGIECVQLSDKDSF